MSNKYYTHERAPFFELARPYINSDSVVLDIGPGMGDFANHMQRTDFYMLEGNPGSAAHLKIKHPNVHLGQLPQLPFDDKQFDVIHCSHVVEHLQPQQFYETLREMDRCLKPGGVLVISAPMMWEGFYNDLSHVKPYNPSVYRKYLCTKTSGALTRAVISTDYEVVKLQYRHRHVNPFSGIERQDNIVASMIGMLLNALGKLGIKKTERTGYTIILRKGQQ